MVDACLQRPQNISYQGYVKYLLDLLYKSACPGTLSNAVVRRRCHVKVISLSNRVTHIQEQTRYLVQDSQGDVMSYQPIKTYGITRDAQLVGAGRSAGGAVSELVN